MVHDVHSVRACHALCVVFTTWQCHLNALYNTWIGLQRKLSANMPRPTKASLLIESSVLKFLLSKIIVHAFERVKKTKRLPLLNAIPEPVLLCLQNENWVFLAVVTAFHLSLPCRAGKYCLHGVNTNEFQFFQRNKKITENVKNKIFVEILLDLKVCDSEPNIPCWGTLI